MYEKAFCILLVRSILLVSRATERFQRPWGKTAKWGLQWWHQPLVLLAGKSSKFCGQVSGVWVHFQFHLCHFLAFWGRRCLFLWILLIGSSSACFLRIPSTPLSVVGSLSTWINIFPWKKRSRQDWGRNWLSTSFCVETVWFFRWGNVNSCFVMEKHYHHHNFVKNIITSLMI